MISKVVLHSHHKEQVASIKRPEFVQHDSYDFDSLEESKDENNLEEMLDEMMERP